MSSVRAQPLDSPPQREPITCEQSLQVWTADNWACRYCNELVFFPPAFRAMSRRFGNHGYFHPNWKADQAPLLIKRGASVDHVTAVTRGGVHDFANFATACWECNVRKNNSESWTPQSVARLPGWDGMLAVFKGIASDRPDQAERRWLRAIKMLGL